MTDEKYTILVVDDDKSCRKMDRIILHDAGYETDVAENGQIAWEKFKKNSYDLLLIDRMMPIMTGDELIKKVRQVDTQIPAIILSALDDQQSREEGIELGANQYINKANINFDRELVAWSKNLIAKYHKKIRNQKKEKRARQTLLRKIDTLARSLNKTKLNHSNNELFVEFELTGAHWNGDYAMLAQKLVASIESLVFPNWENLRAALFLSVNTETILVNTEVGSEDETILKTGLNSIFLELDSERNQDAVRAIWSIPWETQEKGEGIALLINNLPPETNQETCFGFENDNESKREVVQGSAYRFLEFAVRVIGNFEIQRKFKDLVFSASEQLDKAIQEMDANRQKQMIVFESVLSDVSESTELHLNPHDQEKLESILNRRFNSFQELEMNSLNDIQHLLKWVRKLKIQFDETDDSTLSDEADAKQIGGKQEDVESILAQFDL